LAARGGCRLCRREHALDDQAHANRLVAAPPARGQRRRIKPRRGGKRETQDSFVSPGRRVKARCSRRLAAAAARTYWNLAPPPGADHSSRSPDLQVACGGSKREHVARSGDETD